MFVCRDFSCPVRKLRSQTFQLGGEGVSPNTERFHTKGKKHDGSILELLGPMNMSGSAAN